jgi:diacylglycerol O-acyltransferase
VALVQPADAMFLLAERREQPMHVGGLQVFRLPPGDDERWIAATYREVTGPGVVAPLFRRRARRSPTAFGAWSWEDDPDVDLEYHVGRFGLPRPGRVRELLELTSRLHGALLDRHRPLWEACFIEGLEGGRFAVYSKIHHALMDGVSALRLLAETLSTDPDLRWMPMPWAWRPPSRPAQPAGRGLAIADAVRELAGLGPIAARGAFRAVLDPQFGVPPAAPRSLLNRPITGARRFAAQGWPLERVRRVARASGTTVNDVVLAMCGGALRSYLDSLNALPDDPLVAMTPVSLRQAGSEIGGNAVGAILCTLATDRRDPAERLDAIHSSADAGKSALRSMTPLQATLASAALLSPMAAGLLPVVGRYARPAYNLVVSNIPGPAETLYWNGARLEGVYPLSIPTDGQALNVTVTSYAGSLEFGLTGCRRTVPHLQRLLRMLDESLVALEAACGFSGPAERPTFAASAAPPNGSAARPPKGRPGRPGRRQGTTRPT